jgi:hypothetical protein
VYGEEVGYRQYSDARQFPFEEAENLFLMATLNKSFLPHNNESGRLYGSNLLGR